MRPVTTRARSVRGAALGALLLVSCASPPMVTPAPPPQPVASPLPPRPVAASAAPAQAPQPAASVTPAGATPPAFPSVLYGAFYYHEYMPYDRLDEDVELMRAAGLSVMRLGESTWSVFEPADGVFEFAWMDRILDRLHRAGIRV